MLQHREEPHQVYVVATAEPTDEALQQISAKLLKASPVRALGAQVPHVVLGLLAGRGAARQDVHDLVLVRDLLQELRFQVHVVVLGGELHRVGPLLLHEAANKAALPVELGHAALGAEAGDLHAVALAEVRGPHAEGEEPVELLLLLHHALVLVAVVAQLAEDPPQVDAVAGEDPLQELGQLLPLGGLEALTGLAGVAQLVQFTLGLRRTQPDHRLREDGSQLVLVGDLPQVLGLQVLVVLRRNKHAVAALVLRKALHKGLLPVQLLPAL
mmetsp:Transcript_33753/g.105174  ORF Transcript_33753/g.105174 Transcript_33753/m.105174 type:complete len:270 (+) Transcript_33753:655-1464(+)